MPTGARTALAEMKKRRRVVAALLARDDTYVNEILVRSANRGPVEIGLTILVGRRAYEAELRDAKIKESLNE